MLLDGDLNRPTRVLLVQDITFSFMRYAFDDFALLQSLISNDELIILYPLLIYLGISQGQLHPSKHEAVAAQ